MTILKNYHYQECGLEYVYLKQVEVINTPYGKAVNIKNASKLQQKIAQHILKNNYPLRGKELRFLRKACEITQDELATKMGIAQSTINSWEVKSADQTISPPFAYYLIQFFRSLYGIALIAPQNFSSVLKNNYKIAI